MKPTKIAEPDVAADPHRLWNEFVSILAHTHYEDLSEKQRIPYLVFWYESEVQNGGHLQFFLNRGMAHAQPTVGALNDVGADCQAQLLRQALARFKSKTRLVPTTSEAFVAEALKGEFKDLDEKFLACTKTLIQALEEYLSTHHAAFFLRVSAPPR